MSTTPSRAVDVLTPASSSTAQLPYKLLLTCEHASQLLTSPWRWPDEDRRLLNTHWALDLGAEELTRELSAALAAPAVIAKFSRLLVDANRPLDSPTLYRDAADSVPVQLNRELTPDEKRARLEACYFPYHRAVGEVQRAVLPELIVSLHSYTDNYEGQKRSVQVGVLYKDDEDLAKAIRKDLGMYDTRLNEPWSGKEGFMYSADRHAHWDENAFREEQTPTTDQPGAVASAIMLEMRNDLLTDRAWRAQFMEHLIQVLRSDEVVALVQAKKNGEKTSSSSS